MELLCSVGNSIYNLKSLLIHCSKSYVIIRVPVSSTYFSNTFCLLFKNLLSIQKINCFVNHIYSLFGLLSITNAPGKHFFLPTYFLNTLTTKNSYPIKNTLHLSVTQKLKFKLRVKIVLGILIFLVSQFLVNKSTYNLKLVSLNHIDSYVTSRFTNFFIFKFTIYTKSKNSGCYIHTLSWSQLQNINWSKYYVVIRLPVSSTPFRNTFRLLLKKLLLTQKINSFENHIYSLLGNILIIEVLRKQFSLHTYFLNTLILKDLYLIKHTLHLSITTKLKFKLIFKIAFDILISKTSQFLTNNSICNLIVVLLNYIDSYITSRTKNFFIFETTIYIKSKNSGSYIYLSSWPQLTTTASKPFTNFAYLQYTKKPKPKLTSNLVFCIVVFTRRHISILLFTVYLGSHYVTKNSSLIRIQLKLKSRFNFELIKAHSSPNYLNPLKVVFTYLKNYPRYLTLLYEPLHKFYFPKNIHCKNLYCRIFNNPRLNSYRLLFSNLVQHHPLWYLAIINIVVSVTHKSSNNNTNGHTRLFLALGGMFIFGSLSHSNTLIDKNSIVKKVTRNACPTIYKWSKANNTMNFIFILKNYTDLLILLLSSSIPVTTTKHFHKVKKACNSNSVSHFINQNKRVSQLSQLQAIQTTAKTPQPIKICKRVNKLKIGIGKKAQAFYLTKQYSIEFMVLLLRLAGVSTASINSTDSRHNTTPGMYTATECHFSVNIYLQDTLMNLTKMPTSSKLLWRTTPPNPNNG